MKPGSSFATKNPVGKVFHVDTTTTMEVGSKQSHAHNDPTQTLNVRSRRCAPSILSPRQDCSLPTCSRIGNTNPQGSSFDADNFLPGFDTIYAGNWLGQPLQYGPKLLGVGGSTDGSNDDGSADSISCQQTSLRSYYPKSSNTSSASATKKSGAKPTTRGRKRNRNNKNKNKRTATKKRSKNNNSKILGTPIREHFEATKTNTSNGTRRAHAKRREKGAKHKTKRNRNKKTAQAKSAKVKAKASRKSSKRAKRSKAKAKVKNKNATTHGLTRKAHRTPTTPSSASSTSASRFRSKNDAKATTDRPTRSTKSASSFSLHQ